MGTSAIHSRAGFVFLFLHRSDGKRKCCLSESHLNTVLRFILSIQSWDSADNTCKHKHTHQTQVLLAGSEECRLHINKQSWEFLCVCVCCGSWEWRRVSLSSNRRKHIVFYSSWCCFCCFCFWGSLNVCLCRYKKLQQTAKKKMMMMMMAVWCSAEVKSTWIKTDTDIKQGQSERWIAW